MDSRPTPRYPFLTSPVSITCSTTFVICESGIARPMPANCPCPVVPPGRPVAIAVFMPMTRPFTSESGPPELPGLIAASTWMKFSKSMSSRPADRPSPDTMPLDIENRKSKGEPKA